MRRRRHRTGLGRFALAALIGLVAALWTWTRPGDVALWRGAGTPVPVMVLDNGFHTDIAVPRAALRGEGGPLTSAVDRLGPGDWVRVGWGDARFYVETSPIGSRLPDGARAFFRPGNASVVMLDPEPEAPGFALDERETLSLPPAAFGRLRDRIEASLETPPRVAARRRGDNAQFFASREHFWIGNLCNHWTAGLLAAAGLEVRPLRAVTSGEVMRSARRHVRHLDSMSATGL